jgi:hypothetical protein
MEIVIILIIIVLIYILYSKTNYEYMTNLSDAVFISRNNSLCNILHNDVCQIQQPFIGKNRSYVNWQKIHDYHNYNY